MAKSSPHPELVHIYKLLKAGERAEAAKRLKAYLAHNKRDATAWWLLSLALTTPEHIEKALQNVLKLDPTHDKAQARLAQLRGAPPEPSAPPVAPQDAAGPETRVPDDEPDENLFFGTLGRAAPRPSGARSKVVQPLDTPPAAPGDASPAAGTSNVPFYDTFLLSDKVLSFEEYAATTDIAYDPFTGAPVYDPFTHIPPNDDPFSAPDVPALTVQDRVDGQDDQPAQGRTWADQFLAVTVVAFSALVLVAFVLFALNEGGTIDLDIFATSRDMTTLQAASFAIDYPEGYNQRCRQEALGYTVCGIANHALYNEVDWFVDQDVDIGAMLSAALSASFDASVPDEQLSIIVMDVPMHSRSYDNGSWAKTQYEYYQRNPHWDPNASVTYNGREDIVVDGYPAYYYKYTSTGSWVEAAWDLYIPHDGIMFWMRATYFAERGRRIPQDIIDEMIDSIDINPA